MMKAKSKRTQMVYLILNHILPNGFKHLKMDDFIQMLPISRSTVYRYFTSREDIIQAVVAEYVQYLDQFKIPQFPTDQQGWLQLLEQQLEGALILNSHLSAVFLNDLENEFPEQFNQLQDRLRQYEQGQVTFYREGQRQGYFNSSTPELWVLQDRLMVPKLIDSHYLVNHRLTINVAVSSYVSMKKAEIVKPAYQAGFDPSFAESVIDKMNREITMN